MPQIYQGSSKSGQSVSTSILTEKDLTLAHSGHFEEEGLNMVVCPKPELNLGFFGDLEENAFIRFTWVVKGGPKEERTYKCAKKLWKGGGYSFQLEQVTKQHVILNALNNFLRHADGRLSAVWSQLSTNADNVSFSAARYYKRKGAQVLETVFEAIAPGNQSGVRSKLSKSTVIPLIQSWTLLNRHYYLGSLSFTMRPQVGTQGNKSCQSLSVTTVKQSY